MMSPRLRAFRQVDVFTAQPYLGNPLAVILDASDVPAETMQQFTDWTQLSECAFVLPVSEQGDRAGADYRVRIFRPGRELGFAGHPTLGACHAWLAAGGRARSADGSILQECALGLVRIRAHGRGLSFAAPAWRQGGPLCTDELARLTKGLGLSSADIVSHVGFDNGPHWRCVLLRSDEQLLSIRPDATLLNAWNVGLMAPRRSSSDEPSFEVRAFVARPRGLAEDPVTGSLNAGLAQWLMGSRQVPERYSVVQGTALGRAGQVRLSQDAQGTVWVGGDSVTAIEGQLWL